MRVARVAHAGESFYAVIRGDSVERLSSGPTTRPAPSGDLVPLSECRLLAPATPSKIVAVGRNYLEHATEMKVELPERPMIFLKPPTSVIGPDEGIPHPAAAKRIEHESELAIVIGREARKVSRRSALDYVFGYTCANDVTDRDAQRDDGQWARAKGFDGFCPLGPWVETDLNPRDLAVQCRVNGELRQSSRTSALIFPAPDLIEFISGIMTLLPGDVILTGTPAGVGRIEVGDRVEVEVEGIGVLRNTVIADGTTPDAP